MFHHLAPNEGLARFGLYYLSLSGQNLVDGSLSTSIVLCDVNLDDTRPNREGKITRFMERREREVTNVLDMVGTSSDMNKQEEKSMIDVTFRMKENEMFADVKVFSFNLILSVDFLMKLSSFLQPSSDDDDDNDTQIVLNSADFALEQQSAIGREREYETRRRRSSFHRQQSQEQEAAAAKKAVFAIHIEEYDVILVEKMDDINCLALILNVSSILKLINSSRMVN